MENEFKDLVLVTLNESCTYVINPPFVLDCGSGLGRWVVVSGCKVVGVCRRECVSWEWVGKAGWVGVSKWVWPGMDGWEWVGGSEQVGLGGNGWVGIGKEYVGGSGWE